MLVMRNITKAMDMPLEIFWRIITLDCQIPVWTEHSKRQDWSLEAAYDIFPLLEPLLDYTVQKLLDDSNVLRDSVLMQAECLHFEAYLHVCAIMWRVVFKELRGLTNSKGTIKDETIYP